MIILPNKGTVDVIKTENDNLYHNTSFVFKISYVRSSPCIIFKVYHYLEVSSLYLNPDVTRLWCLNFPRNPTEISSTNNSQSLYMQQLDQWQSCTNSFHKLPVLHCQLKSTNISILSQNNIKNARNNMANKSNASISFRNCCSCCGFQPVQCINFCIVELLHFVNGHMQKMKFTHKQRTINSNGSSVLL